MQKFLKILRFFVAPVALVLAGPVVAQASTAAPDVLVRDLTADVLDTIRADKAIANGDVSRVQKLVDEKILPYVDFQKMTRLAVGRGWRSATPEQREVLTREFRTLLVRTYSGALSQVKDHKVEMGPFRAQPGDMDVLDAGWKIYDVNVLGVWLVENYKTQFAGEVSAGGVDGLIKSLTDRNRQLADAKKA
ncbi:MAG: hypothetical protein H6R02_3087 [Burkholderiaceae bacterium]|nr:hypothetical protein [Burkholderiaceae bacterium]